MDNLPMSDRANRTIYVRDFLIQKAIAYGKRPDVDRSYSRVIEIALVEFLRSRGVDLSDDPLKDSAD